MAEKHYHSYFIRSYSCTNTLSRHQVLIHANPVKAKLVTSAKDYRWSSFRAFYFGQSEPLAVDQDWWWPDDVQKLKQAAKDLAQAGRKNNEAI
jgi:hypothetical protein